MVVVSVNRLAQLLSWWWLTVARKVLNAGRIMEFRKSAVVTCDQRRWVKEKRK